MKEITLTIMVDDFPNGAREIEVKAIQLNDYFAFVDRGCPSTLTLTHIKTGHLVCKVENLMKAESALKEIEALQLDWDFDDPSTTSRWDEEIRKSVRAIRDQYDPGFMRLKYQQ